MLDLSPTNLAHGHLMIPVWPRHLIIVPTNPAHTPFFIGTNKAIEPPLLDFSQPEIHQGKFRSLKTKTGFDYGRDRWCLPEPFGMLAIQIAPLVGPFRLKPSAIFHPLGAH